VDVDHFFAYARERYNIKLRKENPKDNPPWTTDPVLQTYRFCNVFREDDRTTQWFAYHIRWPQSDYASVVLSTVIFRWFNRIETGQALLENNLLTDWNPKRAKKALRPLSPLVTGAYMIKTPAKLSKLDGLIWCINNVWRERDSIQEELEAAETLEWAHSRLMQFPYLGSFMAYEIVTDLRHTAALEDATDILTWASAGPGAARGLGRVLCGDPDEYSYGSRAHQEVMLMAMNHILTVSRRVKHWPMHWPRWEMREVEHTLCEFDKYERARLGEGRPKQRYTPCK
jgi:hypothetical protein